LKVNGVSTDNINEYKENLGYVMQEDFMLPTFTPFESFKFIADIRLSNKTE
jgi:ABC-type multidrug transport system ATPase subunit